MPVRKHPYSGQMAALATMHGKAAAIGPALQRCLGLRLQLAHGIDTDALGTFTGETARAGSMADAARAKARLAREATGLSLAVASEGSFGPHPSLPFVAAGRELLLWRDEALNMEITVSRVTPTNYWTGTFTAEAMPAADVLAAAGFPTHALTVRPDGETVRADQVVKGIQTAEALRSAIRTAARQSSTGLALVQTDMRAHMNPTRMRAIGQLARRLALRLARLCPACGAPGFGLVDVVRGLPCKDCGQPTRLVLAEIHGCAACGHRETRRQRPGTYRASAQWCDSCNP